MSASLVWPRSMNATATAHAGTLKKKSYLLIFFFLSLLLSSSGKSMLLFVAVFFDENRCFTYVCFVVVLLSSICCLLFVVCLLCSDGYCECRSNLQTDKWSICQYQGCPWNCSGNKKQFHCT